jgi:hypothetical protein
MKKRTPTRRIKPVPVATGQFPKGWDQKRARAIAAYYDNQTDEAAIDEAEAAYNNTRVSMMPIPVDLVPAVQALIKRRRAG